MSKRDKYYDVIIIGSGIAGLYTAYKIKKYFPATSFLILEKYKRQWVGGRTSNSNFQGVTVMTGAGVGREDTNPLLIQLLRELHVPYEKSMAVMEYSPLLPQPSQFDVVKVIAYLQSVYEKHPDKYKKLTFKQFAIKQLGKPFYDLFTAYTGYTDFEKADVYETLYNYGMDDTKGGWVKLYIPWKELVDKLCSFIGPEHIKYSNNVTKITRETDENNSFEIQTEEGHEYHCRRVIIATTIDGIQKLVPKSSPSKDLYKQIHGQPFLRLYAKFDQKSAKLLQEVVKGYTILPRPLQKIIPMNADKGVYMISYSDNESATALKPYLDDTQKNRHVLEGLVERSLGLSPKSLKILAMKDFYWPIGTHYYEPLHGVKNREEFLYKVQHPMPGMLVVGEAVSTYQGWVEGALESVENVFPQNEHP